MKYTIRHRLHDAVRRDYYAGILMILIGLGTVEQCRHYTFGTLTAMGPGFFPTCLGAILTTLGIAIAFSARRKREDTDADKKTRHLEWRGWLCILSSLAAFVLVGKYGGLIPASFAIVYISAMGDRDHTFRSAFVLASAVTAVSVVVFWWALQVQIPLFTWG